MPHARFIEQNDPTVLAQLLRTSDLPGFVTDVSEFERSFGDDAGRVRIPIQDADAHATFYAVALLDAPQAVANIMSSLRRHGVEMHVGSTVASDSCETGSEKMST